MPIQCAPCERAKPTFTLAYANGERQFVQDKAILPAATQIRNLERISEEWREAPAIEIAAGGRKRQVSAAADTTR